MPDVTVFVSEEASDTPAPDPDKLERYAVRVLESVECAESEVTIVFAGDACLAELNEQYRKRGGATDVLTFTLSEPDEPVLGGEIYVSLDRAAVQAAEYGVTAEEETVRLVTHGLLHLSGRVHDTDELYREMTADTEILVRRYLSGEWTA